MKRFCQLEEVGARVFIDACNDAKGRRVHPALRKLQRRECAATGLQDRKTCK